MASYVNRPLCIGIVAGEISGDLLAAGLLRQLKTMGVAFTAVGIAGPELKKLGCLSLFPIEVLSIMGIGEILKRLPQLLRIRQQLIQYFISNPPDIFIGIDAPEFNLSIEKILKQKGIKTMHYVSPSVWAWRRWRLRKIAKAVDLMLTLFSFEEFFYKQNNIPVQYVGHPLADSIPLTINFLQTRRLLKLPETGSIIALLPGSRKNEIDYLGRIFLKTAKCCYAQDSSLLFVAAMVNETISAQFMSLKLSIAPDLPITIIHGQSREVMAASDVVLLASGTATLEAMLLKKPMVVAYRMSIFSYWIARWLVKIKYIALPNLLANKALVPEFIQKKVTPEKLSRALLYYLYNPTVVSKLQKKFLVIHHQLRCQANVKAANALLKLLSII